jgi:hypothetical protein
MQRTAETKDSKAAKERSESGDSNEQAMEQAQEQAAQEREDERGYQ